MQLPNSLIYFQCSLGDTWYFSFFTQRWSALASPLAKPSARYGFVSGQMGNYWYITHGKSKRIIITLCFSLLYTLYITGSPLTGSSLQQVIQRLMVCFPILGHLVSYPSPGVESILAERTGVRLQWEDTLQLVELIQEE